MKPSAKEECLELAEEILRGYELQNISNEGLILKSLRLCRLLGDEKGIALFTCEAYGYPSDGKAEGIPLDEADIARLASRSSFKSEDGRTKEYFNLQLLSVLDNNLEASKIRLSVSVDPNISLSEKPTPFFNTAVLSGNKNERANIISLISDTSKIQQRVKGALYDYVLRLYLGLSYGNVIEKELSKAEDFVQMQLAKICPNSVQKLISAYENMDSKNPEDWANAIHSCRRIMEDLADVLYPPREPLFVDNKKIELGRNNYINRIIQWIQNRQHSKTFKNVVSSDIAYMGKRIDAIWESLNKGTHEELTFDEAERYLVHFNFLVSDVLSLLDDSDFQEMEREISHDKE